MFSLFRINDPYRLIIVLVILLVIRSVFWIIGVPLTDLELKFLLIGERLGDGFVMYRDLYDYTSPLSALVYKWIDIIFGRSRVVHQILSTGLIFLNATIFNLLLVRNKAYSENNYLSGLFYILFSLAITDFFVLSPQLMSITFILLALNNVFRRIDNQVSDELFLYAGLYLGIATLFYFPSIIFFLVLLGSLVAFSNVIIRRVFLFFYGLLVPLLVTYGYFFWFEGADYLVRSVIWRGLFHEPVRFLSKNTMIWVVAVPFFWYLVSFFKTIISVRYGIYESKILRTMVYLSLAAGLIMYIDVDFSTTQLVFFVPTLSYFMTHFALARRKRILSYVMPYLIVMTLVAAPFYLMYDDRGFFETLETEDADANQSKLMLLDSGLEMYKSYHIASPFLDPVLSKKNLEGLEYYETSYQIFAAINGNKPDIIVDRWSMMDSIFYRFPILEENYRESSNGTYEAVTSN